MNGKKAAALGVPGALRALGRPPGGPGGEPRLLPAPAPSAPERGRFDFTAGIYHRNIYAEANPTVIKELGDVGNDIGIYGGKLYAVINVSNYIEVMDAKTTRHIGEIKIPNVRYIKFHNGKAYASSYVAPVKFDQNARVDYVAEIDTATLKVTRTVNVGYQPEELAIVNNKIYVAKQRDRKSVV